MARALTPRGTFEYVLRADRSLPADSPDRTVWILRNLNLAERTEISDLSASVADSGAAVNVKWGSLQLRTLRYGIVGVRSFRNSAGQEIRCARTKVGGREITDDGFIALINADDRTELVEAISTDSELDVETAGKSSPPPTPSTTEG